MAQKRNSEMVQNLRSDFVTHNNVQYQLGDVISHYLTLPGLIGFWPMATVQRSTGNVPNYAPTYTGATKQDLVYNGNPTFNYTTTGVPYIDLDGTGDYLSVADNTDLAVQGNEAQYTNPGITFGCWFWSNGGAGTNRGLISKAGSVATISFYSLVTTTNNFAFAYSTNGAVGAGNSESVASSATVSTGAWHLGICRWTPSTERSVFLDGIQTQVASSGFATIFNSSSALEIGRVFSGNLLSGREALTFLCASSLSDAIIQLLYKKTYSLFA